METHSPQEKNRDTLYGYFENGKRPSAENFKDFINSTINKLDDGISKSFKDGLKISPEGAKNGDMENVISFYERIDANDPSWVFSLVGEKEDKKLYIRSGKTGKVLLTLTSDGHIGVMNESPTTALDVDGTLRMTQRTGSYSSGTVRANKSWHTISKSPLKGCKMFEISAFAYGKEGEGKYASIHAIASNAYSGKKGRIHCSRDFYSWRWWQRIRLRWIGTPFDYKLQIKTCSDYGSDGQIQYNITQLGQDFLYKSEQDKLKVQMNKDFPET